MNEPGNDLSSRPVDDQETVEGLRRQVNLMFSGLIITSFTLTAYLGLQARRSSGDLLLIEPRAQQMMKLSQQDAASMQPIVVKLQEFARTHPDFQKQIFSKYNFNLNPEPAPAKK